MGFVDQVVGALIVGSWTNMMLYTLELVGMWRYFTTYKQDHWFLKACVSLSLVSDTLGTVVNCVCVYRYVITNFGDFAALGVQGWEFPVYLTTSTVSAAVCQWYLIFRYWRPSKNTLVSLMLMGVSLTAKGCAIYTDYALTAFSSLAERGKLVTSATTWLSCEFAADVLIAAALVVYLASFMRDSFSDTRSILYRLILLAAESGSFTTLIAVAALATFLTAQQTNTCVGIAWNLGRAYTLTLLLNLCIRKHSGSTSGSQSKSLAGTFNFPLSTVGKRNNRGPDFEGVTVDHETAMYIGADSKLDAGRDDPVEVTFDSDDRSSSHKARI